MDNIVKVPLKFCSRYLDISGNDDVLRDYNYKHYLSSAIVVISTCHLPVDFITTEFTTRQKTSLDSVGPVRDKGNRKMKQNKGNLGLLDPDNNNSPSTTTTTSRESRAIKPTVSNVGKAVTSARGKSKRRIISDNQYAEIIHRAMEVQKTLGGCQPGIIDFLCYGLTTDDINSTWGDLQWLYPDFDKKGPVVIVVPETVVAA